MFSLVSCSKFEFASTYVAGMFIGTILALVFSGLLCDSGVDNGWPLIFYVYGIKFYARRQSYLFIC